MACFVEILEVKGIVPDLLQTAAGEILLANFKFDNEKNMIDEKHHIDSLAQSWHDKLEVGSSSTFETRKRFLQNSQLLYPSVPLCGFDRELTVSRQAS